MPHPGGKHYGSLERERPTMHRIGEKSTYNKKRLKDRYQSEYKKDHQSNLVHSKSNYELARSPAALKPNDYDVLRPAGGSVRGLHQHHAVSALDQRRFKTREPDEYKNPFRAH